MTVAEIGPLAALGRGRALVDPALREAVARLDPQTRLVTSYHLGWCDRHGATRRGNPGKAVRPALVFLACEAVAGDAAPGLPGAVAVELVHNFSLVHDDLMDRDRERRHRPTVWSVWGEPTAILAGDAMLSLAHEVLADLATSRAELAGQALARATRGLIRGQAMDVAFETRADVGLSECLDMAAGKTGALLAVSAEIGAILGGASAPACQALRSYGLELGIAFQLVDDLLGIWGWPERTGKPVFSDLRSRKKTLPVVWALQHGGAAGTELARWLDRPGEAGDDDLRHAADLVDRAGGRDWSAGEARRRATRATSSLEGVGLQPLVVSQLCELADCVVEREL